MNYTAGTVNGAQFGSNSYFDLGITGSANRTVSIFDISGVYDSSLYTNILGITASNSYNAQFFGADTATNSSVSFILTPQAGTMTGGTITVYGYRKA
jgi:hypothetical protein